MQFNVNYLVRVQLTQEGRTYHQKRHVDMFQNLIPYRPPEEDTEGWSRWHLWELMQQFGPGMAMGCPLLFHTVIDLELPNDAPNQEAK